MRLQQRPKLYHKAVIMKHPKPDIGDTLLSSFLANVSTVRKLKKYWGTTTIDGVEVLVQRQFYHPTSYQSPTYEKLFTFLDTYEDVENADGEELEPFVFDEEIIDKEGNYIAYTLQFPDNFNINLIKPIDRAIRGCLIAKTLLKWMERKGRNIEKLAVSEIKSIYRLKRSINLRSTLKKTYRMY